MSKTGSVLLASIVAAVTAIAAMVMLRSGSERTSPVPDPAPVERGRYLVQIGGCNDCHTPQFPESGGRVEEALWLTGTTVGWQGPWGTTYPVNLRQYMQDLTQEQWLQLARTKPARPPMPYYILQIMTDEDLRAMYQYIRSLGPAGDPAPPYLPPGTAAATPVIVFPASPG